MLDLGLSLILGDLLYDRQLAAVQLRRGQLPALDRLVAVLPHSVRLDAKPGDDVSLDLDGGDEAGAPGGTVFTGRVTAITRSAQDVRVTAMNGGVRLAAFRPTVSLQSLSAADAIRQLAGEVGVDVTIDADGPDLALHALDGRLSAARIIADLARLSGQTAAFAADGRLLVNAEGGSSARMALKYGREILALSLTTAGDDGPALSVVGEGGAAPATARGRLIAPDFDSGAAGEAGVDTRRIALPQVRTSAAAKAASGALALQRKRQTTPVRLTTFLLPALAPGMEVEFADMPDHLPLAGMRIAEVVHSIRPGRHAQTEARGSGETGTDPLAFLGDLLGLAGVLP